MVEYLNLKSLEPRIILLSEIKLAAQIRLMSFSEDMTNELWRGFSPLIRSIPSRSDNDRYSVQIYPDNKYFERFDPTRRFKKCAAVKVNTFDNLPESLEELTIPSGQYAVFGYIGKPSEAADTFQYMLTKWLPASEYRLDDRPHLSIMGEKYKGEYSDSEEELLIPIIQKDI